MPNLFLAFRFLALYSRYNANDLYVPRTVADYEARALSEKEDAELEGL